MARPTQPTLIKLPRKHDFITDGMSDADARAAHKRFLAAMAAFKENRAARAEWMKTHATAEEKATREEAVKPIGKITSEGEETSASEGYQAKMDRLKKEAQAEEQRKREAADAGGSAPQDK